MKCILAGGLAALVFFVGCRTQAPVSRNSNAAPVPPSSSPVATTMATVPGQATASEPVFGAVPGPSQARVTLPSPMIEPSPPPQAKAAPNPKPAPTPKPAPAVKPARTEKPRQAAGKTEDQIVTADTSLRGKVTRYNDVGRFMVLEFPIAQMPAKGKTLFVYRSGLKVGEAKVTGPQRDDRTVADLVTGEAQPGDEVRDQ